MNLKPRSSRDSATAARPSAACTLGLIACAWVAALLPRPAPASGECGLACCLAGASTSGVTLTAGMGLSVQYENARMGTIRHGTTAVTADEVINRHWTAGTSYSAPTQMTMRKLSLIGVYPAGERWRAVAILPYVENEMRMRMKTASGAVMDMAMDPVSGVGDASLLGLYTAYSDSPIRPTQRLTLGAGLKTPTGQSDVRTDTGTLLHATMQPGTGSWDVLFVANYVRALYPLVLQANLFYHLTTEGREGYEFGDQFAYDLATRYQVADYVNMGLEVNGVNTTRDKDHAGRFSRPTTSMLDSPGYTGLRSRFLSVVVQLKIPDTGGAVELRYQLPVHQDVRGYQQVVDSRLLASLIWGF